jgi:hypothetical protein
MIKTSLNYSSLTSSSINRSKETSYINVRIRTKKTRVIGIRRKRIRK